MIEKSRVGHRPKKGADSAPFRGKTKDIASEITGLSHDTIQKILFLDKEEKKGNPLAAKLLDDIDKKGKKVNFAYQELKREKLKETPPPEFPDGKYGLIYMDFPWEYENKTRIAPKYRTMTVEDGKKMKLAADKDCVLFFWTTMSNISQSQDLLDSWGFEIKSEIIWVKMKDKKLQMNPGYYANGSHEKLYICTKGNPGTPLVKYNSVIFAPKAGRDEHSKKPHQFYDMIEKMYPHKSKIEYFARNSRKGWKSFGEK